VKQVTVRYFAALREQRGLSEERVETAAETAGDLYEHLRGAHGLSLPAARVRAAVNDAFVPWNAVLRDNDTVAFLPPVSGG
jgi:sulfur-carrier protein